MNTTRSTVQKKRPVDKFINEWKEHHSTTIRNKKKEKQWKMMEKRWDEYLLPLFKQHKDPDTSSVFSYNSNATESSTNQKQQSTSYRPNISKITMIQRPAITRYGADIPKKVLDNISVFEGKQGELTQFLNTIESYSTMYRVCKRPCTTMI